MTDVKDGHSPAWSVILDTESSASGIDAALAAQDDPNWSRTIYDAYNDREIVLSDRDLMLIERMRSGQFAHPEFEAYPPMYESGKKEIHPIGSEPEPKRRFLPSKWEAMKVSRTL